MTTRSVQGLDKVAAAMRQLPDKLAEQLTRSVLRQGANDMARKIRAAAPVDTGRLRRAIRVRTSKIHRLRKNGHVGVYVTVYPGKNRKDLKGAWYGRFVENGYNRGSKAVTGGQAVRLGVVSRQQLAAKKREVALKRRFGKAKQGIRYRAGGRRVEGQHFVRDTFNANAEQAAARIVAAGEVAALAVAKRLGLEVK
ncbi:HK97-gp10 family putative phage morphogenesis protein [Methylomonas sp. MED-D]|uniref:HK97-gp10 family putative phage morphogenesis protein n=1 Tax=Methylomonas sp. MED-D TaxID=3418768 RepID=UPI003D021181